MLLPLARWRPCLLRKGARKCVHTHLLLCTTTCADLVLPVPCSAHPANLLVSICGSFYASAFVFLITSLPQSRCPARECALLYGASLCALVECAQHPHAPKKHSRGRQGVGRGGLELETLCTFQAPAPGRPSPHQYGAGMAIASHSCLSIAPYTLHPTPYALHPAPCTLHPLGSKHASANTRRISKP